MKIRRILFPILSVICAGGLILTGILLYVNFKESDLSEISNSFEIVFYLSTITIGSLGLIKYWDSITTRRKETNILKYKMLNESYDDFVRSNREIITMFEWPHKFEELLLTLKKSKTLSDETEKNNSQNEEYIISQISKLDKFLDFFENIYYAVKKDILEYSDLQIFFHYFIVTLHETYFNEKNTVFRDYVENYYFNIEVFLEEYVKQCNGKTKA